LILHTVGAGHAGVVKQHHVRCGNGQRIAASPRSCLDGDGSVEWLEIECGSRSVDRHKQVVERVGQQIHVPLKRRICNNRRAQGVQPNVGWVRHVENPLISTQLVEREHHTHRVRCCRWEDGPNVGDVESHPPFKGVRGIFNTGVGLQAAAIRDWGHHEVGTRLRHSRVWGQTVSGRPRC
jgi:hypothetical protein